MYFSDAVLAGTQWMLSVQIIIVHLHDSYVELATPKSK